VIELDATAATKRRITIEIWIMLGLSLGASAVYSIVDILRTVTSPGGLAKATATLNQSQAPGQPWFDLAYQLLGIFFALVSVALAIYLLARDHPRVFKLLGLDLTRPGWDLLNGVGLAALIGIPGLLFYLFMRSIGLNVKVVPAALPHIWWGIPILVLSAIQNAIGEEVIVVGYLTTRLNDIGWRLPAMIIASAVLRGSYHLYQGLGGFIGNFIMGLIFALVYRMWGRVMPLIVAHSILDIVSFVGYDLFAKHVSFLH
jgi:membrane protease YdiL (CAAX protease family)